MDYAAFQSLFIFAVYSKLSVLIGGLRDGGC